jgi:hypothetical protein
MVAQYIGGILMISGGFLILVGIGLLAANWAVDIYRKMVDKVDRGWY